MSARKSPSDPAATPRSRAADPTWLGGDRGFRVGAGPPARPGSEVRARLPRSHALSPSAATWAGSPPAEEETEALRGDATRAGPLPGPPLGQARVAPRGARSQPRLQARRAQRSPADSGSSVALLPLPGPSWLSIPVIRAPNCPPHSCSVSSIHLWPIPKPPFAPNLRDILRAAGAGPQLESSARRAEPLAELSQLDLFSNPPKLPPHLSENCGGKTSAGREAATRLNPGRVALQVTYVWRCSYFICKTRLVIATLQGCCKDKMRWRVSLKRGNSIDNIFRKHLSRAGETNSRNLLN